MKRYIHTDIVRRFMEVEFDSHFKFDAYVTLTLSETNDFDLKIEFYNLDEDGLKAVTAIFHLNRAVKFDCPYLLKEGYNISHVVIEKIDVPGSALPVVFYCLSDNPISLEVK